MAYKKQWLSILLFSVAALVSVSFNRKKFSESPAPTAGGEAFESFAMEDLLKKLQDSGKNYLPFLNRETLRCGIYSLPAGAKDQQSPHQLDEVYYVLDGKARFTAGEEEVGVKKGDVLFVKAFTEHHFHSIEEDLQLLVFFSTSKQ